MEQLETTEAPISVVLADDHEVVRQGLRVLLDLQPGLKVVGDAPNGPQAVQLVVRHRPDVLVVDLAAPDMEGLAVTRSVRQKVPGTKVVVL